VWLLFRNHGQGTNVFISQGLGNRLRAQSGITSLILRLLVESPSVLLLTFRGQSGWTFRRQNQLVITDDQKERIHQAEISVAAAAGELERVLGLARMPPRDSIGMDKRPLSPEELILLFLKRFNEQIASQIKFLETKHLYQHVTACMNDTMTELLSRLTYNKEGVLEFVNKQSTIASPSRREKGYSAELGTPECLAATLCLGQLEDELCDQFAARGIDLCDERQVPDEEYAALIKCLERQAGLDRFDDRKQLAAILWLTRHCESA